MSLILKYDLGNPHRLPVGYTPLAYIESSGTLYIDTTCLGNSNTSIILDYIYTELVSSAGIIGTGRGSTTEPMNGFRFYYNGANKYYVSCNSKLNASTLPSSPLYYAGERYHTLMNGSSGVITTNGISVTVGSHGAGTENTYSLMLFKAYSACCKAKLYKCIITQNGISVRDFIPAKNSSGVVGLFDCVSQTFFTNQGTGSFIAGPEVVVLPYEYLLVEYLTFNVGLYINTSLAITSGKSTITTALMFYKSGESGRDLMGWSVAAADYWGVTANGTWEKVTGSNSDITKFNYLNYTYTTTANGTYLIGALNGDYLSRTKYISAFKVSIDGVVQRNMIACYRRSDMKPGMYDTVNNVFYTNSGSGEFILGPVVEESSRQLEYNQVYTSYENPGKLRLPSTYQEVQYLQSSGTLWINTTYPYNSTNTTYRVLCKFLMVSVNTNWLGVYGAYLGEDYNAFRLLRGNSNTSFLFTTNARAGANNNRVEVNSIFNEFIVDHSYSKYELTDLTTNNTYTNSSPVHGNGTDCTSTFYVFSQASSSCLAPEKIFYFKLYDNNQLRVHLIPCYRKSDSKPGMYDLVTNTFLTNAGSGEFTLGPNVLDTVGLPINIHHSISNPSSTLINLGSGDFNTNSWIKLPQLQNLTHGSISFWLKVNTLKNIVIVGNEDKLYYLGATRNGTGAWYHHNCGTITTYVDGVVKTTPTADINWHHIVFTGVNLSTWTTAYLNKYISESSGWNVAGCYYDFRIYDNVLTADEVLKIYKGGL